MYISADKMQLLRKEITFLGFKVSADEIKVREEKTKTFQDFPIPSSPTQVRALIGTVNYFSSYISNAHLYLGCINQLARPQTTPKFVATDFEKLIMKTLLAKLSRAGTRFQFQPDLPLILACDASAIGKTIEKTNH